MEHVGKYASHMDPMGFLNHHINHDAHRKSLAHSSHFFEHISWIYWRYTLRKFDMNPKNQPIEKEHHLPNLHSWVQNLHFGGVWEKTTIWEVNNPSGHFPRQPGPRRPFWGLTWVGETKSWICVFFGEKHVPNNWTTGTPKIDGSFKRCLGQIYSLDVEKCFFLRPFLVHFWSSIA